MNDLVKQIAVALHNHYLGFASDGDATVSFERLKEDYKRSLLDQAQYWFTQIKDAGYRLVASDSQKPVDIPDRVIEFWAKREHDRFVRERLSQGWRLGYPKQGPPERVSPYLVPFGELSRRIADYDRGFARAIPGILRKTGLVVTGKPKKEALVPPERDFRIGIIGHRRLNAPDTIKDKVFKAVSDIASSVKETDITVVTSLAEGTDQIGAEIAINEFSAKLKVVMPLLEDRYFETFDSPAGIRKAKQLIARSDRIIHLPPVIMPDGLSNQVSAEQLAFQQAGRYVVDDADAMVVVWDGHNGDAGGTADTMEYLESLKDTWNPECIIIRP